ncbi:hypothetical protein ACFQ49_05015 [Kroppenstedtia eburnea]|uniref:hypothetical protein n=1 Tax=Kroppenstedtia eburnea TaxID=714067 RepID=UPI00363F2322
MVKNPSFWGITVALFLAAFLTLHPGVFAAEKAEQDLSEKVEHLEKEMKQLSAKADSYDYLKEETKAYREFVEGEWDRFINWFIVFVGIASGAIAFLNWTSQKEIKNNVREQLHKQVEEELNRETKRLRSRIRDLEEVVSRESWLRSSKILALDRGRLKNIISSSPLNQQNVTYDSPPFNRLPYLLTKGEVDIIVYEYDHESEELRDEDLIYLLDQLKHHSNRSVPIPIVIYTNGKNVDNTEIEGLLDQYEWYTYANHRITLIANTYSLTHAYYSEVKNA